MIVRCSSKTEAVDEDRQEERSEECTYFTLEKSAAILTSLPS